jgi:spermidine synthase
VLILLSLAVYIPNKLEKSVAARVLVVILAIYAAFFNNGVSTVFKGAIAESDTQYGTILVIDRDNVRNMYIDIARSSGRYLDSDELVFEYTKYYDLALFFNPVAKKVLAFGGAGYSYPQYFVNKYADKEIDVVELDPKTTELAREYFGLTDNPRLRIFHNDARIFLSNNETKYDAILGDAFSSSTPPFQLVTKEVNERIYDSLNSNGVYIVNIIDALEGENSKFFSAYYHTLLQTFSQVLVFVPRQGGAKTDVRNITFVALKNQTSDINSDDDYMSSMLDRIYNSVPDKSIILTDEYAPVEYLARW